LKLARVQVPDDEDEDGVRAEEEGIHVASVDLHKFNSALFEGMEK
jgi:hypothetical protein